MILVDTSVLINLLRGTEGEKTELLREVVEKGLPFGISALTYQEILQGAKDEREYSMLEQYLGSQKIYYPPPNDEFYTKASCIFYSLRGKGVTLRGTIDVLIAATAIENDLRLLHDDKDFDTMERNIPELKVLHSFGG